MPSITASVNGNASWIVMPRPRSDFSDNAAAEVLNVAANDVHADAAARNVGNLLRGGKARQEYEIVDLVLGEHSLRR